MKYKTKLVMEFREKGKVTNCPVYDLHGHMGPWRSIYFPYPEPEDMVKRMERAGVKMLVFCHHAGLFASDIGNIKNIEAVRQFPDKLRAYCGINPNYPEIIEKDLKTFEQYKDVYVGFKFLSDYHKIATTNKRYQPVLEFADERELLILLHTWGGSMYDGEENIRKIAGKYQRLKIILGHSCHGQWAEAIKLAVNFPNVYLDLCAVLDERSGLLEKFVKGAGSKKVLFGTDFPWFNHHYYIGGVLAADITDKDRRNIFYGNAERLLTPFLTRGKE